MGDPRSAPACARVELACAAGTATLERSTACYSGGARLDLAALPTWDLYVSTAALAAMRPWGPPPARRATRAFRAAAFAALGLA